MLSKKGGNNKAAKDLLAFIGIRRRPGRLRRGRHLQHRTAKGADTSKFTPLNKKCADAIANAKYISQFLDRDALPAMANNVMIPALQAFIKDGNIDTKNLEAQAKTAVRSPVADGSDDLPLVPAAPAAAGDAGRPRRPPAAGADRPAGGSAG